ncbi:MAG: SusC/RagA family TonB-linked outer membrane protein [Porphyromonadaceae bacterium]|nr:SusC/RagA family TonB-linked outer membrane protein [Porphyromonadaceae bacterium]
MKLIHFRYYIIGFFLLCYIGVNAQYVIQGVIKDAADQEPLIGATIAEVDKENRFIAGTSSDADGRFQFRVSSPNASLRVSYIGYVSKDIKLKGEKTLEVLLESDTRQMEEVVVIAQARTTNSMMPIAERDLSTAVGKLDAAQLAEVPVTSVGEMLQGRISGVDITSISGDPGSGVSIRIRGTSSLSTNSEPLIVVDGIPYETKIDTRVNFATATQEDFGAMLDISPADIESIEVLKDAAAAAVWGAQGANGVLVITTKRGTKGRTQFSYDTKLSTVGEPKSVPMLSGYEYAMLQTEALFNAQGVVNIPKEIAYDSEWFNYHNYAQNTDWIGALTQRSFSQEHNFSLTGGGEKARYRTSVSFLDQRGTTINTGLKRIATRFNMDYDLSDRIRFSADISYTNMNADRSYSDNIRQMAYRKAPNMGIYEMDANGNRTGKYFAPEMSYQGTGYDFYNPVALAKDGMNKERTNRVIAKFFLRYYFIPEILYWSSDAAFDFMDNNARRFFPQSASGADWQSGNMNRMTESDREGSTIQTFNKLIFTPKINEDHRITSLLNFSTYDKSSVSMAQSGTNTSVYTISQVSDAMRLLSLSSAKSKIRTVSLLGNVNYVMFDRYIITAGLRLDGDSRFGTASRWGLFPAISGAWRLSSEPFTENWTWMNDFKIKASYGENGTPPNTAYGHFSRYGASGTYDDIGSIVPLNIQLDNLKWETVIQSNLGVDFAFLNNKLSGSFDLYNKRTKDVIFVNVSIPSSSGYTTLTAQNWGTIDNKGWELNLNTNFYKEKDWDVNFNFNFAQNKNYIVEIPAGYNDQRYTYNNGEYARRIAVGKPIGSIFGYRYLGVYATDQDALVKDANGNIVYNYATGEPLVMRSKNGASSFVGGAAIYEDIDHNGVIDERDLVYLGDSNPLLTGGFGPNIRWKNFMLNAFFHFKYDFDVVNNTRMQTENMYTRNNQNTATLRRWRRQGDNTDIPRALLGRGYNWLGSDRFVEDASYLRLKNISLAYSLDRELLKKYNLKSVKLYVTAYNVFTWTKYTGQDPEISIYTSNPFALAVDNSRTPPGKMFTFGLNVSF